MRNASVAIWDRKKVVTWAAIGLWVTNSACLIQGEPLPLSPDHRESQVNMVGNRSCHGEHSITAILDFLG